MHGPLIFDGLVNDIDGMQGGGMISIEAFANRLKGRVRILARQVNGYLARTNNRLPAGVGDDFSQRNAVVLAHQLLDYIDGDLFALSSNMLDLIRGSYG